MHVSSALAAVLCTIAFVCLAVSCGGGGDSGKVVVGARGRSGPER